MADEIGNLSWDDLDEIDEELTEEDIKAAEGMGRMPIGKYLCKCVGSIPRQKDFKEYSCIAANLRWNVLKVLELNKKAVVGDEAEIFEGRSIFDDVNLYSPAEKDGMRKRRILIAKRTGLIKNSDEKMTKEMWRTGIIGKKAILDFVEDSWFDERTKTTKTSRKVDFSGYESAEGIEIKDNSPDIDSI